MKNAPMKLAAWVLFVLLLFAAVSCGGGGVDETASPAKTTETTPTQTDTPEKEPVVSGQVVTIKDFAFNPASLTLAVGEKVTWINEGSVRHTVTIDSRPDGYALSSEIGPGGTMSATFGTAYTYTYRCDIYPQMQGELVVS